MTIMWMVQAAIHQIADVITMRDGFMSAAGSVDVIRIVAEHVCIDRNAASGVL